MGIFGYNQIGRISVTWGVGEFNISNYCIPKCKVVGNIYQNPELLK